MKVPDLRCDARESLLQISLALDPACVYVVNTIRLVVYVGTSSPVCEDHDNGTIASQSVYRLCFSGFVLKGISDPVS